MEVVIITSTIIMRTSSMVKKLGIMFIFTLFKINLLYINFFSVKKKIRGVIIKFDNPVRDWL